MIRINYRCYDINKQQRFDYIGRETVEALYQYYPFSTNQYEMWPIRLITDVSLCREWVRLTMSVAASSVHCTRSGPIIKHW